MPDQFPMPISEFLARSPKGRVFDISDCVCTDGAQPYDYLRNWLQGISLRLSRPPVLQTIISNASKDYGVIDIPTTNDYVSNNSGTLSFLDPFLGKLKAYLNAYTFTWKVYHPGLDRVYAVTTTLSKAIAKINPYTYNVEEYYVAPSSYSLQGGSIAIDAAGKIHGNSSVGSSFWIFDPYLEVFEKQGSEGDDFTDGSLGTYAMDRCLYVSGSDEIMYWDFSGHVRFVSSAGAYLGGVNVTIAGTPNSRNADLAVYSPYEDLIYVSLDEQVIHVIDPYLRSVVATIDVTDYAGAYDIVSMSYDPTTGTIWVGHANINYHACALRNLECYMVRLGQSSTNIGAVTWIPTKNVLVMCANSKQNIYG